MKRERLARIKNIRDMLSAVGVTVTDLGMELDHIWDEETKELEKEDFEVTDWQEEVEESYPRIEDLKEGDQDLVLKAEVVAMKTVKDPNDKWELLSVTISDGTSNINLPLWNEQKKKIKGVSVGDWCIFKVWKAEMYKNQLQLVGGKGLTITRLSAK
jgi:hypothetical protein